MSNFMDSIHRSMAKQGAIRPNDGRVLGGACAGVANMLRADANAVRFVFVLALMMLPGSQILVYPVMWLAMPDERRAQELLNGAYYDVPQAAPAQPQHPAAGQHPATAQYSTTAQYPATGTQGQVQDESLNLSK